MKKFSCVLMAFLFILCVQTQGFAQTSNDKNIEVCFGEIRADLFRYACEILDVNDTALTNRIESISLNNFKNAVNNDTVSAHQPLKQIVGYSPTIDSTKSLPVNYTRLYAFIDSVCNSLKKNVVDQSDAIDDERKNFHNILATSAIKYNAYQTIIQVAKTDSVFVTEQFCKLFPCGFPALKSQKDKDIEKTSEDESNIGSCQKDNSKTENQNVTVQENRTTNNKDKEDQAGHFKHILAKILKYIILTLLIVAIVFVYYWFVIRPKSQKMKNDSNKLETPVQNRNNLIQKGDVDKTMTSEVASGMQPKKENVLIAPRKAEEKKDRCFFYDDNSVSIVGASVIGNSHVSMKLPCQDCCGYESLGKGWGIAVTSDGAGSAEHSEIGSGIVVSRAIEHFKHYLTTKNWLIQNYVPTDAEWTQITYNIIKDIYNDMKDFSEKRSFELKSLNATVIVIIHTPYGLLTCHVGDGRAGYRNASGDWKSVITPHKGEEANQTIFVTSGFWSIPNYVMSGVMVPECRVIKDKVTAFTLMSDGCEATSWLYNQQNENGKFYDPNLPFPKFFNPLTESLKKMHEANTPNDERLSGWQDFLMTGGKFANEPDDKTMILGLILQ